MTSSFTNTFGGSAVSASDVAFAAYTFSSNLTLFWPAFSAGQTNVAARFMNLTATASSLNVYMPDATLVSVGYDVIIFNAGSNTFNVVDSTGGAIATIASGQTYYILLTDNSTAAGTWQTVQFGVGTGSASAAALAGAGLLAAAGLLNVNFDAQTQSSDYTISSTSRAILQVWTGGAGTITLPSAASVGDGFFFPVANNGSGSVTVATSGGDDIDGGSASIFTQTQSGFIISSGSAWYTVGKGIQNNFSVTLLNLDVAGNSDVTETSAQAQNIIQQYTGILTGNINVIVPATVQLYYVYNNTSGSYTLTVKTASGTGILIPQATHVILYCDGTNVIGAFTTNTVTVGSVFYALGTVGGTANALTGSASDFILQVGTFVTFNPLSANTTAATLDVQGTGLIPIRKVAAVGIVDVSPNDIFPGIPVIAYYDGTQWVDVTIVYDGVYQVLTTDSTLAFGNLFNSIICTSALNLTLTATADLENYYYVTIFASGGAVTLIPDAGDSINGLPAGTHYVVPQSGSAKLVTDGAGNWTLFTLTTPIIVDDTSTNSIVYPVWSYGDSGTQTLQSSSTKLNYNPSTGLLTATGFSGPLTGNVTGNLTGNVTGNISGTAPAGTLTGTTLASGVTASSLTSFGASPALGTPASGVLTNCTGTASGLTAGHVTTNANLTGGVTSVGNAATVVTNANLTGDVTSSGNATTIKSSVALAGSPTTTTQSAGDKSTKIATTAYVDNNILGGAAQAWIVETGSRVLGTTYTNSTNRPIAVSVTVLMTASGGLTLTMTVGGVITFNSEVTQPGGTTNYISGFTIVPAGATYVVAATGGTGLAINQWAELR